jgi:transcriptional regulator with XRE-family HTH domain
MNDDLRLARKAAGLTLAQVAGMFGLSREWLRQVEKGEQPITPERRAEILQVISRMSALAERLRQNVHKGIQKLREKVQGPTGHHFKNRKTVGGR